MTHRLPVPVFCDRCGAEADAQWHDATNFSSGSGFDYILGRCVCATPGCVDEDGSSSVPPPDEPGQLTREDNRWLDGQRRLIAEVAAVERRLLAEVGIL